MKNYINRKKELAKHKHIMFWNLKSSKRDLKSQNLSFIPNAQFNLNLFTPKLHTKLDQLK